MEVNPSTNTPNSRSLNVTTALIIRLIIAGLLSAVVLTIFGAVFFSSKPSSRIS